MKNYLLGFDIGSSSIKASLIDGDSGKLVGSSFSPEEEMKIDSPESGWAEQHPDNWWKNLVTATKNVISSIGDEDFKIHGIGISYQMHGLVCVDRDLNVIYPSIIWCDSRTVQTGKEIASKIGVEKSLESYLNLPGNFTISKLYWLKKNMPEVYSKIYKVMLPGDYIAMRLTGSAATTISGLSEGIMWDFEQRQTAFELFDILDIDRSLIPDLVDTFGIQGNVNESAAKELGIESGITVSYRAGDQPNNAFSLNVLKDGDAAATAGTSGVVYGVSDKKFVDDASRVNSFAHVNYSKEHPKTGVLLCINGTGILYRWLRSEVFGRTDSYENLNKMCRNITEGSDGLLTLPFGNGSERILENKIVSGTFSGIDYNKHTKAHIVRSALEGIVFAFRFGLDIMSENGLSINVVKVGHANLFLSEEFTQIFADVCNVKVLVHNTDGAQGAARGAGVGCGFFKGFEDAFNNLKIIKTVEPNEESRTKYEDIYTAWMDLLNKHLND